MSIQVKYSKQNVFVDDVDELMGVLKNFAGTHLAVIETLPSGIKKPHYLSVDAKGTPFYTYLDDKRFGPEDLQVKG
jgi:hypothetical protein